MNTNCQMSVLYWHQWWNSYLPEWQWQKQSTGKREQLSWWLTASESASSSTNTLTITHYQHQSQLTTTFSFSVEYSCMTNWHLVSLCYINRWQTVNGTAFIKKIISLSANFSASETMVIKYCKQIITTHSNLLPPEAFTQDLSKHS